MELKIYGKNDDGIKAVIKTYTADEYDLEWGTIEDVVAATNLDEMKTGDNMELLNAAWSLLRSSSETVRGLMLDIFPGLTREELRHAKGKDMVRVVYAVLMYFIAEINNIATGKN